MHLTPRTGTYLPLLNGIQHLMFKNNWIDRAYVDKHVVGLQALEKTVSEYTPEKEEEITGVAATKLQQAAQIIRTTPTLLSTSLQGVYQSNQATASACQINNINLMRGLIGKPDSGVLLMNGQPRLKITVKWVAMAKFPVSATTRIRHISTNWPSSGTWTRFEFHTVMS